VVMDPCAVGNAIVDVNESDDAIKIWCIYMVYIMVVPVLNEFIPLNSIVCFENK